MRRDTRTALAMAASAVMAVVLAGCAPAVAAQDGTDETQSFRTVHDWSEPKEPSGMVRIMQEIEAKEAAQAEQEAAQAALEAEYEYEGGYAEYGACSGSQGFSGRDYGNPFKSQGVATLGDAEFTWYSQNALPGEGLTELNANGRHVDESTGFVVDGDGYIAVASPWGREEIGTVVETPYGPGKVYDANEGDAYDLFTDF